MIDEEYGIACEGRELFAFHVAWGGWEGWKEWKDDRESVYHHLLALRVERHCNGVAIYEIIVGPLRAYVGHLKESDAPSRL
jgi:hypothetical protein